VVRLLLMVLFLRWFGIAGLPLVTFLSAGGVALWLAWRLRRRIRINAAWPLSIHEGVPLSALGVAAGIGGILFKAHHWTGFVLAALLWLWEQLRWCRMGSRDFAML